MRGTIIVCVAAALLAACSEPEPFAAWPGEPDDLVLLLSLEPGAQATLVGVSQGQALLRQELETGSTLFAVVVPLSFLRRSHASIDLDPAALKQVQLVSDADPMCTTEVTLTGDRVYLPAPDLDTFEYVATDGFVASLTTTESLLAGRVLSLLLSTEPCRLPGSPQPFEIEGPVLLADDDSMSLVAVRREGEDVLIGLSRSYVYVYERGRPARNLRIRQGAFLDMRPVSVDAHRNGQGRDIVVGLRTMGEDSAGGALAFVRDDGSQLSLRTMFATPTKIESLEVDPSGRLVISGRGDHFWTGTASSTVVDLHIFDEMGDLHYGTFGPAGEVYIGLQGTLLRANFDRPNQYQSFTLLESGDQPSTSPIRGIAVVDQTIFAATAGRGVFRFAPGQDVSSRLEVGIARPQSLCVSNRNCAGADYFYFNNAMAHLPAANGDDWLFFSSSTCSLISMIEVNSGCTTEVGTEDRVVSISANEHGVVFATSREIFEIKQAQLPSLAVK